MFNFFKYKTKFYPLESILIEKVIYNAPEIYQDKLRQHIDSVAKIQRHSGYKEINLYPLKEGKPYYDSALLLPQKDSENAICTIDFIENNSKVSFRVQAWLVEGFFFTLTFNKSPKHFIKCDDINIKNIKNDYDCLQLSEKDSTLRVNEDAIKAMLGEYNYARIQPPLSEENKKHYLNKYESIFPKDYLKLLTCCDGLEIDDGIIYGLKTIRQVVAENDNYLLLAEYPGGCLVIPEGSEDGKIYYYDYETHEATFRGNSFVEALKILFEV